MKRRITKYLAIAAIVTALLLIVVGWCVTFWLRSEGGRALVEKKLSEALHMPVKIESPGFSFWSGISTGRITVSGPDGVIFEAAGMSAGHSFLSLFRGRMGLSEVRIREPHVRLYQDASGRWGIRRGIVSPVGGVAVAPVPAAPAEDDTQPMVGAPLAFQPGSGTAAVPAAPVPATPAPRPRGTPSAPRKTSKTPDVSVGKILVENGTFEMIDMTNAPFATVTGLNVTMRDVTGQEFSGNMSIGRAILHGVVAIEHIGGNVTRNGDSLALSNLSAETGGGVISGDANYTAGGTAAVSLKLAAINIASATLAGGMKGQKISGIVSGDAQVAGIGPDKRALTGAGSLSLKGGDCSQFEVLRQIGEVLRVTMLAKFQVADVTAKFQVANEQVTLAPMEVVTPPIGLAFAGPVAFDGTMNLTAFLSAPADIVDVQPLIAANFLPPDANNRRSVAFHITGSYKKPRQDLADALTGTKNHREQNIIGGASVLGAILGRNSPKLMKKLAPALELVKPTLDRVLPGNEPAAPPQQ